jgi:hypothetical protein
LQFIADGRDPRTSDGLLFPTFDDGCRAAIITDALTRSHAAGGVWTNV